MSFMSRPHFLVNNPKTGVYNVGSLLTMPYGYIAFDSVGNAFITGNGVIKKMTPDGTVTTFAGDGTYGGYADGYTTAAKFYSVGNIACDSKDNLYCIDHNSRIRKITKYGQVTTLAGAAFSSKTQMINGSLANARFNDLQGGICIDSEDNIYVVDRCTIRKISPSRDLVESWVGYNGTLVSGYEPEGYVNGVGNVARFNFNVTSSLCIDKSTNTIYAADGLNSAIRKITSDRTVSTLAGGTTKYDTGYLNGTGTAARFHYCESIVIDSNKNLYVTDTWNYRIRKITLAGVVTTAAGSGIADNEGTYYSRTSYIDGAGLDSTFRQLSNIAIDSNDRIHILDRGNYNNNQSYPQPQTVVRRMVEV